MTTPPSVLEQRFEPFSGTIKLVSSGNQLIANIGYTDALARIVAGEVEGVGPSSGKLKCLRELPESLRVRTQQPDELPNTRKQKPRGGAANAQTQLGVYWEQLRNASGDRVAGCWSFCLLRTSEGSR